jgi:hypothetical protein
MVALYNLKVDPAEQKNVIANQQKRFLSMKKTLLAARTSNANWDIPKE